MEPGIWGDPGSQRSQGRAAEKRNPERERTLQTRKVSLSTRAYETTESGNGYPALRVYREEFSKLMRVWK